MIFKNLIPNSWTNAPIKELGIIQTGNTPSKKDASNYGDYIPLVKPPELNDKIIDDAQDHLSKKGADRARILSENSILVSCIGNLGKTAMNKIPVAFNQQINSVTFYNGIHPKYGFYYFQSPYTRYQLEDFASATTISIVNKSKFSNIEFPIAPYNEQIRIVGRVEELFSRLDAGVRSLQAAQTQLEQYRQTTLKQAYTGKLTQNWRQKNPKLHAHDLIEDIIKRRKESWEVKEIEKMRNKNKIPKDNKWKRKFKNPVIPIIDDQPDIPENWAWATWDQISEWVTYGFTRPMPHYSEGVPIITAKNVFTSYIDFNNVHQTDINSFNSLSEKDKPRKNDILITKDGTIGRAAIVKTETPFCINQSVAVVWLRECPLNRKYLVSIIQSPYTQEKIQLKARGVALKHLSITDFKKMALPIPPLEEQQIIEKTLNERLSIIDYVKKNIIKITSKSHNLKQVILKKAFEGRLVPQDLKDEPASILLERIKAQKEKQMKLM